LKRIAIDRIAIDRIAIDRIAIDMDETIADAVGKHITLYNEAFGAAIHRDQLVGFGIRGAIPEEHHAAAEAMVHSGAFFADLDVIPESQAVIHDLQAKFEVFITSSAMEVPSSFAAKFTWLERHFPFIPSSHIVFCGDKSILAADYLIDDTPRHFKHFRGEGILFSAPHNRSVQGFRRVESWLDVRKMFL
jgi:5'(3')-deoxyribonucleotidase